jgi:hypothetical protein
MQLCGVLSGSEMPHQVQPEFGILRVVGSDNGGFLVRCAAFCQIHPDCDLSLASGRDCPVVEGYATSADGNLVDLQRSSPLVLHGERVFAGLPRPDKAKVVCGFRKLDNRDGFGRRRGTGGISLLKAWCALVRGGVSESRPPPQKDHNKSRDQKGSRHSGFHFPKAAGMCARQREDKNIHWRSRRVSRRQAGRTVVLRGSASRWRRYTHGGHYPVLRDRQPRKAGNPAPPGSANPKGGMRPSPCRSGAEAVIAPRE